MSTGAQEITEKLEAAVSEDVSETSESHNEETEVTTEEAGTEEGEKGKTNAVPQARFNEVIASKNEALKRVSALEAKLEEATTSQAKLTDLLDSAKEAEAILNDVRALHADPTMAKHVEAIDKKLRGIEEDVAEEKLTPEQGAQKASKLLEQRQDALENELAEAKSQAMISRADIIAEKWLADLPEEYTEQDRKVVANLWTEKMGDKWASIEENPDSLDATLKETYQESVDLFGQPRGGLVAPGEVETTEQAAPEPVSPEKELEALVANKKYGEVKTVTDKSGKEKLIATVPDDQFEKDFAEALKIAHKAE